MNRQPSVDPQLAARVWAAVAALNYFPNNQARALVSGKSRLLGLIVSDITNPFFPELIHEFEQVAVDRGYEILIGSTNYDPAKMARVARRLVERKVDGVAVMTFGIEEGVFDRLIADNIPMVFVDSAPNHPLSSALTIDYRTGIHQAVQHLAVLGHRRIGFISGPLELRSSEARKTAFLECVRAIGLKPNPAWLITGDHTLSGGRDAMAQLLKLTDQPTAILCSNDMTAIGVQHALFEAGLSVPDDFSLIGYDDIHLAEYTIPPLTTVRMSCKDLALRAVSILIAKLQPLQTTALPEKSIATSLVVRRTTDIPRNALADLPGGERTLRAASGGHSGE
jgi:LacI family transcriptional regulator